MHCSASTFMIYKFFLGARTHFLFKRCIDLQFGELLFKFDCNYVELVNVIYFTNNRSGAIIFEI